MKQFLVIALFSFIVSCKEEPRHMSIAREHFSEYLSTSNNAYLDSSYQSLKSGKYLNSKSLNSKNYDLIAALLLYMRKYDELEILLKANKTLEVRKKDLLLNLTLALKLFKTDSVASKGYIIESLKIIKKEIASNPNDSLLFRDYIGMRFYLVGKQQALQEIDSIKRINNKFSDSFFKYFLVGYIEEYPDELMFERPKDSL